MSMYKLTTTRNPHDNRLYQLLQADPVHAYIHAVDMPYRITSIWQDNGCDIGIWKRSGEVLAWAVFQPAWFNLDFAIHPTERGSSLETEIFSWGIDQMTHYARRIGDDFWGSVEIFEDTPDVDKTIRNLHSLGFAKFDWSILRFTLDLSQDLPPAQLPVGFTIRPLRGKGEVGSYVDLHRAAFESKTMTKAWRTRTLEHPAYRPGIDLVLENPQGMPVGFCVCWLRGDCAQIEPLGVHPDYQGQGLGKALELTAYHVLKEHGVRVMQVDHMSMNEGAIALSLKTGFHQSNNALRYYVDIA